METAVPFARTRRKSFPGQRCGHEINKRGSRDNELDRGEKRHGDTYQGDFADRKTVLLQNHRAT